jgi:hypothetical protein
MQQSSMASVEEYADNPDTVDATEKGDSYVVQLVPSHKVLMKVLKQNSSTSRIEGLSNSYCMLTLTVDKNTYHLRNFAMELEADVTIQRKTAKMNYEGERHH